MYDVLLALVTAWLLALIALCAILYFGPNKVAPCNCGRRLRHDCPEEFEHGCLLGLHHRDETP